jgi:hypothetical protein
MRESLDIGQIHRNEDIARARGDDWLSEVKRQERQLENNNEMENMTMEQMNETRKKIITDNEKWRKEQASKRTGVSHKEAIALATEAVEKSFPKMKTNHRIAFETLDSFKDKLVTATINMRENVSAESFSAYVKAKKELETAEESFMEYLAAERSDDTTR